MIKKILIVDLHSNLEIVGKDFDAINKSFQHTQPFFKIVKGKQKVAITVTTYKGYSFLYAIEINPKKVTSNELNTLEILINGLEEYINGLVYTSQEDSLDDLNTRMFSHCEILGELLEIKGDKLNEEH